VALKTGIKLPLDSWNEVNSIIEKTADNKCSMLQDIENNQMTEIEAINGEIIRIADRNGIPVPYNKKIITEIKNLSINS
jgi:2-dehydropantoate 2-reductase